MQHFATVGLGADRVDLDDDRAGDKILTFEMNPAAMLRPAAGDETARGNGTADHRKYQAGVVARDLQAEELHGVFPFPGGAILFSLDTLCAMDSQLQSRASKPYGGDRHDHEKCNSS